jgi:hypothetical protein
MEWLWIVVGVVGVGIVGKWIQSGRVLRRVRRLSEFAYQIYPDLFREPVGRMEAVDVLNATMDMHQSTPGLHFDIACLYNLARRPLTDGVVREVIRAWDQASRPA